MTPDTMVKVIVAGSCGPCQEVKQLIEEGRFITGKEDEEIDLIDLETEEGFPYLEKLGLKKVPTAYQGEHECKLSINDEERTLVIDCGEKEPADGNE